MQSSDERSADVQVLELFAEITEPEFEAILVEVELSADLEDLSPE